MKHNNNFLFLFKASITFFAQTKPITLGIGLSQLITTEKDIF